MLERIFWIVATLLTVVVGFFFLAAAAVAGIVIAAVVLVRLWWLKRRLGNIAEQQVITTEYTVVERESPLSNRLSVENDQSRHPEGAPPADGKPGA